MDLKDDIASCVQIYPQTSPLGEYADQAKWKLIGYSRLGKDEFMF